MTEDEEGALEVVGILNGGGIDCSKLGDENYQPTTNGRWMRVSKFKEWIDEKIRPGSTILFIKTYFS